MPRFLGLGNGSDGVVNLSSYSVIVASCSGTSGTTTLTATGSFSAGQRLFIHQSRGAGAGSYEDNRVASYSAGTITLVHPLENTYTDSGASQAQVVVVKEASSVTGSIIVSPWDGNVGGLFPIACNGVFSGTINANGKGYRGGRAGQDPNGSTQDNITGEQGEGTSGASARSTSANGNGAGGGYAPSPINGEGGHGAGGGYATAGSSGTTRPSASTSIGGGAVGQAEITSLYFGGGGSGGGFGDAENLPLSSSGGGGAGGGAIVVYANKITSSASLTANGNNGQSEAADQGAGGGGAGGSILIKSVNSDVSGTITASAGTGGNGGNGSVGRIRIESCGVTGTTSPTASTSIGGHSYCGGSAFLL